MKKLHVWCSILVIGFTSEIYAQNQEEAPVRNKSYYEQRALEDAEYEQEFNAENEVKDQEFWEDQKQYEKDLKKRDRKVYRAYIKGKRDAYAEHYSHCDNHCRHSEHYYTHATFYYYGYDRNNYRSSRGTSLRTNVKLSTPRIRVGFL